MHRDIRFANWIADPCLVAIGVSAMTGLPPLHRVEKLASRMADIQVPAIGAR